uniref:three-finger toxin 3FTx-Oxy6 n=1 Tax=Semicossyphus pulcher TaxID=241346 RepID=UPI0037E6F7A2
MKVLLLTLLLLLSSTQVLTLKCYNCNGADDTCSVTTVCPSSTEYCKVFSNNGAVTRSCADTCVEDTNTSCCSEDLCNSP